MTGLIIKEIIGSGGIGTVPDSGGFHHAATVRVVDVGCGIPCVHLDHAIFGVISVVVGPVVEQIARSVVRVAVHAVVVLRSAWIVAGEGGEESLRAVLLPAV